MRSLLIVSILILISSLATAGEAFRVFTGSGEPSTMEAVTERAEGAEVVFVGEGHDDPTAHAFELEILRRLAASGPVVLSLEMFETDVQQVLDEYLARWISEEHLEKSGRAWKNYKTDYRPMVEFARTEKIPVVAANAPRRYVNRVSREGPASLAALPPAALQWLPPLPYGEAAEAYAAKFLKLMEGTRERASAEPKVNPAHVLAAQSLWDASMAYSIAQTRMRHPAARILHVNGSFHTEERLGILHHLARYRPSTQSLVVTVKSTESFPNWDPKLQGAGDFVIVADPSLLRSYSPMPVPKDKEDTANDQPAVKREESK